MDEQTIYKRMANFKDEVETFVNQERIQQGNGLLTFEYSRYLKVPSEFGMGLRVMVKNGLGYVAVYNAEVSGQGEMFYSSRNFSLNGYYDIVGQLRGI